MGIFNEKEFGHELAINSIVEKSVADLVMAQQREIKRLKEKVDVISEQITELTALVNRLT